jgi:hypothetical protein
MDVNEPNLTAWHEENTKTKKVKIS